MIEVSLRSVTTLGTSTIPGSGNNSTVLPPVEGSSTSRSHKRVGTTFERTQRDVRKVVPKVLIEVKRRNRKKKDDKNKTQYLRHTGAFSTPQGHLSNFETLKGRVIVESK